MLYPLHNTELTCDIKSSHKKLSPVPWKELTFYQPTPETLPDGWDFSWGMRSPMRYPCFVSPSSEASTQKLMRPFLKGSSTSFTGAGLSTSCWERWMCLTFGWRGWVPGQMLEVRQWPGEFGQASLDVCLRKYQPCRMIQELEQGNGRWKRVFKQLFDCLSSLFRFRNEFLVIIALIQPAVLIVVRNSWWFYCCLVPTFKNANLLWRLFLNHSCGEEFAVSW